MFSGEPAQFPVPGAEYIPLVQGHKSRASDTAYTEGPKSWDNAMEQSSRKHTAPSIPSSASRNILEENNTVPGNLLGRKNALTEEEMASQPIHSNWQVHSLISGYIFSVLLLAYAYI